MLYARPGFTLAVAALAFSLASTPAKAQQALVSDNPSFCVGKDGALTACTAEQNLFTRTYYPRNAFVFKTSVGCLDGSGGQGNRVRLSACNGNLTQDWYVVDERHIQNKANNLCLDVKDERFAQGNPVILWGCNSKKNQNNQNFGLASVRQLAAGEKAKSLHSIRQSLDNGTISARELIDVGGGYVIAAGGANVKGSGRKAEKVIAAGGANVIAAGGANVIAAGGYNVDEPANVIAAGGANVDESGNVIAAGGANVIAAGGANVIAAGGANVIAAGGANYTTLSVGTATASGQLSVGGKSNIFAAGRNAVPDLYYGGGELPPQITVAGMSSLSFPSVSGVVAFTGSKDTGHPDGITDYPRTNIDAYQGISGIIHDNRIMFLVGVFLDDGEPTGPAPASLNVTGDNAKSQIDPGMWQVFFIGDGKSTTGEEQQFIVPAGATRLFLGFADSNGFEGEAATYGDNSGAMAVSYQTYKAQ